MSVLKRLPMYLQHEQSECGYACVAMIATYFGHDIDIAYLRARFSGACQGTTLLHLRAMFSKLHLSSLALKASLEELQQLALPAVLHWNLNHFVVLKKIKSGRYWIYDPAVGVQVYKRQDLSKCYTGVALTVESTEAFTAIAAKNKISALDFVRCVATGKWLVLLGIGLSMVIESGQMIQAFMVQYITDSVVGMHDTLHVWRITLGMLLIFSVFSALDYLRGLVTLSFSTQLKTQFLQNAMRHLVHLPLSYFEKRQMGQFHLIFQAIESIQRKFGAEFVQAITELFVVGLNGCVMMYYSIELSMVVFVSILLIGLCRYQSYFQLRTARQQGLYYHGKTLSLFLETLQMMMPLKAYGKELQKWTQWRHAHVDSMNIEFTQSCTQLRYQVVTQLFLYIEYIILICWGVSLIDAGRLSLGMLMAFLSFRLIFVNRSNSLTQRVLDYVLMRVELEKVQDFVSQEQENIVTARTGFLDPALKPRDVGVLQGEQLQDIGRLALRHITYAHDEQRAAILNQIDLDVHPGEKLVITGPSGSGKTTLMKIMMGLLPADHGDIYVDGCLLHEFGLNRYRQHIACVLQADQLMSGSIRENIVFFDDHTDWDWLEEVARLAAIHDLIKGLPMKYETRLSEMGAGLSGGERQRLLLARALYKRPQFLFLDEATSHLDKDTERQVNEELKQLKMTQISIAHRQETIDMADRVIYLSKGGKLEC